MTSKKRQKQEQEIQKLSEYVVKDGVVKDGVLCDAKTGYKMTEPCACLRPATPEEMASDARLVNVSGNYSNLPPGCYIAAPSCTYCKGHGYRPRLAGGYP